MSRIESTLKCPRCKGVDFLEGPRGGLAVNIKCDACGYPMTVTRLPGGKYWITEEGLHDG